MEEKSTSRPFLSVVVPLFNEEGNVEKLHSKIVSACNALKRPYEIIFVDDGSHDKTLEEARALSPLTLIEFRRNFGQTAAFDAGFKASQGEIIVTMDGDLQNDPADIKLLLEEIEKNDFDVVSGWRHKRKDSLSKKIFSRGANLLRKVLLHDTIHDSGCSLKAFRRECFDNLDLYGEMHRFIPALLEIQGFRIGEVKVSHHPRTQGITKYNWKRGIKGFVDMVSVWFWNRYSHRPVHLFGGAGLLLLFMGSFLLTWMAIEKIFFGAELSEKIWPLMGVFFIMIGVQFFIFGLLADIVTKIYYKDHKRMNYSIKRITKKEI
ncbi:MAG: glycosyltransferase family 2 protein [Candidatus Moraniibacteriota bacterium]|nr:MAG: glycosyltransferase family 2 protein [Candidatus Moranbacteria bacterium]